MIISRYHWNPFPDRGVLDSTVERCDAYRNRSYSSC